MHQIVEQYGLIPHPEGGFFKENFRSSLNVATSQGERSALTSIYYCLTKGDVSKFHKLLSDEVWYWHAGGSCTVHVRTLRGATEQRICGPTDVGGQPSIAIERGEWFCTTIDAETEYSLVSAAVAPGFDFADFTMAKKSVLVLCTGNTCRSQMAEGWLNTIPGIVALSAGVRAEKNVNPYAVRVMEEVGIDISTHHPKTVQSMLGMPFTDVITVCGHADETCPTFPGSIVRTHLPVNDPLHATGTDDELMVVYRKTRDELRSLLMNWIAD